MITQTVDQPVTADGDAADDTGHVVCCKDETLSLCQREIPVEVPWREDDGPATCVVCADLDELPCWQACPLLARRE